MSIASVASLVDLLRDSQLLDAAQLEQLAKDLATQPDDPRALANLLILRGWLTAYQVDQVFLGMAQELVLGPYRLLELLGQGGMGQVFKALHMRLNRIVALKIIRQERLSKDMEAVKRFHREAQAAAQLSHPNVVIIFDADQIGTKHFISMEYVDGIDLAKLVKQAGPLPVYRACDYIRQAALGLQHAHERGMVHRDIKPSNLLVTTPPPSQSQPGGRGISGLHARPLLTRGRREQAEKTPPDAAAKTDVPGGPAEGAIVKILDMGLARLIQPTDGEFTSNTSLTQEGAVMGTPDYIAPEQARNSHTVDIRADLYSLGCTFYFLLTGRPPFPEGTPIEKLLMHQLDVPRPVEEFRSQVSPGAAMILRKLMAKRPEDRYQSPIEVAEALAPFASGSSPHVARPGAASSDENPPSTAVVNVTPAAVPRKREIIPPSGPAPPTRLWVLRGHGGWVMAVAFSPNRDLLASAGIDGAIRLCDFSDKKPREREIRPGNMGEVHSLAFSTDNKLLAAGSGTLDGLIWLWDVSGTEPQKRAYVQGHKAPVDALAFSPDNKLLASAGGDFTVRLWDLTVREPKEWALLKGHTDFVKTVAFSPDSKMLASGSQDGTVRLWSVGRMWCKELAIIKAHMGHVQTVAFSPDGKMLASGSQDMTVRLWDLKSGAPTEAGILEGHKNVVRAILFQPDGKTLVSVGAGRRVIIWDIATAAKSKEWLLPQAMLCSFALTYDGRYLATGNSDGTVFVFRLAERRSEPEGGVSATP